MRESRRVRDSKGKAENKFSEQRISSQGEQVPDANAILANISHQLALLQLQSQLSKLEQNQQNQQPQNAPIAQPNQCQTEIKANDQAAAEANQLNSQMSEEKVTQSLTTMQYELSIELENSLEKLKQVIAESEQLAGKINQLLGQRKN